MMDAMQNAMKLAASISSNATAQSRVGIVSSFDTDNYAAKVMFQPENVESGWLPILSVWAGNGWGMFCPPSIGDQVNVDFQEGVAESGYISARFFNDEDRPVRSIPGEFRLIHKSGAVIKMNNDGTISISASAINSTGAWTHNGNMSIVGGDVRADSISLKGHHHNGDSGGTTSGAIA